MVYFNCLSIVMENYNRNQSWIHASLDPRSFHITSNELRTSDREKILLIFHCRVNFLNKINHFLEEENYHSLNKDMMLFLFKKLNSKSITQKN